MEIIYKNKKIEKQCTNLKTAQKNFNKQVSEKLFSVINFIESATCLNDIKNMPMYNLHSLKGDREGTYAIDLGRRLGFRLIIEPLNELRKRWSTKDENEILRSTKMILILEVTNHYE